MPPTGITGTLLEGRVIFLTGGGGGIGRAAACRLAREGAVVAVSDARKNAAEETAKLIARDGGVALAIECDVSDEVQVESAYSIADDLGAIDGLALCAGVAVSGPTHELSWEAWSRVLDVNLGGVFLAAKHGLRRLIARGGGTVVTIGSVASFIAAGSAVPYPASKAGVSMLTRYLAVEYAHSGIRANCVCPGQVATDFKANSEALLQTEVAPRSINPTVAPLQRHADPDEIASVVAFLTSHESSFMTGACVMADGGYTAL